MTRSLAGASALVFLSASAAAALGLDRSGQDITSIFEPGNFAQLSFGIAQPTVGGEDIAGSPLPGAAGVYDDVGETFSIVSGAMTYEVSPKLSIGLILDEPYGADVVYDGDPNTTYFGGTLARVSSFGATLLGRYRINDSFSVHGGLRYAEVDADVVLSGLAYGPPLALGLPSLNGYRAELRSGSGMGYVVGAAYERPAIALRVALTYASEIELDFESAEFLGTTPVGTGDTAVIAPESFNLDFQTGIAADTLLFGQIRRAAYSDTLVSPAFFNLATLGDSITDLEDGTAYTLGVGRRFTDQLSASIAVTHEPEGTDDLVSPLAPTNGQNSIQVGAQYAVSEALTVGLGVRYTKLGDALPETGTPDVARGTFEDNDAVSFGLEVGYRF